MGRTQNAALTHQLAAEAIAVRDGADERRLASGTFRTFRRRGADHRVRRTRTPSFHHRDLSSTLMKYSFNISQSLAR